MFYFKVQHVEGDVDLDKNVGEDHMWANVDELTGTMPKQIVNAVRPAIFVAPKVDFTVFLDSVQEKKQLEGLHLVQSSQ